MSKYLMYCPETDTVCGQIADRYNALEDLTGELDGAVAMTYAATGFGVGNIRQSILIQKTEIEKQMANLLLIQRTLSEIKNCTETYENNARNLVLKAIIIEKIEDIFDYNGSGTISWDDFFSFLDDLESYYSGVLTTIDLIQILGEFDNSELNDFLKVFGPALKITSILLDFSEGDWQGGAETAVKWLAKTLIKTVTGPLSVANSFGVGFLLSWAWNAGEAIAENVSDFKNGEGVFADGVDAGDFVVATADIVLDSAGETVYCTWHCSRCVCCRIMGYRWRNL